MRVSSWGLVKNRAQTGPCRIMAEVTRERNAGCVIRVVFQIWIFWP
jgi:hypothetical protein